MKKALSLVLFLGLLLLTSALASKKDSLVKRINNAFKMFSIANFVEEYTPSKYAEKLLDEDLEVDGLSIKIQLVRDSISAVLDHLGFAEGVILKVAAAKVSQLMDSMDLFVGIALGQKEAKDLVDLVGFIPELTDVTNFNNKLKDGDKVKDAIDFIKDIIHPDSVVNKKPATRVAGKSSRKSKKVVEDDDEANQKLNKEEGQQLDEDLSNDDQDMKDDAAGDVAAAPTTRKEEVSNDLDNDDDSNMKNEDNGDQDLDDQPMKNDEPAKRKRGEDVPKPIETKRKLSHRKKEKNGRASKTNILGNFVEVPTAKRITNKNQNKDLDTLLDDEPIKAEGEPMKNDNGDGLDGDDGMKEEGEEPMKKETGDLPMKNENGDLPLKEGNGEGQLGDTDDLKQETPPKVVQKARRKQETPPKVVQGSRRMSGKKNKKIKGLTRKALKKRIKPSFMTEKEIESAEKKDLSDSDDVSFISLREDNKTNLKGKKSTKHEAKVHRKANSDDEDLSEDSEMVKRGKGETATGNTDNLDEQLNDDVDNDLNDDGELKGKDETNTDQGLNDNEESDASTPAARKAHKHRRF